MIIQEVMDIVFILEVIRNHAEIFKKDLAVMQIDANLVIKNYENFIFLLFILKSFIILFLIIVKKNNLIKK